MSDPKDRYVIDPIARTLTDSLTGNVMFTACEDYHIFRLEQLRGAAVFENLGNCQLRYAPNHRGFVNIYDGELQIMYEGVEDTIPDIEIVYRTDGWDQTPIPDDYIYGGSNVWLAESGVAWAWGSGETIGTHP